MSYNYVRVLVEEIALEGLDGITLQALWVRLENRKEGRMTMDQPMKEFLWRQVQRLTSVDLFLIPTARPDMMLPKFPDPERDIETVLCDVMQHMKLLYPYCPIDQDGEKGSSRTYSQRKSAPHEIYKITLNDCEKRYGSRLVIVANQETRARALMGANMFWMEMAVQHYCVLESIGRGRHMGMYSFGPASLQEVMKADPRTMFYIRNKLLVRGILTKQLHILRSNNTMCRTYLLQLAKFHSTIKSNVILKQERLLNVLSAQPERRLVYSDLRDALGMEALPFKKMTASMHANGVIEFLQNVPHRTMYPEAQPSEYLKKDGTEKLVRLVVLKRDTLEEPKPEGDDDSDDESKDFPGLLDQTNQTLDRTLLYQAYQAVEVSGAEGVTQRQLGLHLGLSKLDSRTVSRALVKEGFVSTQMMDSGRQRITKYTAIRLQRKDYRLALEREKFISLTGSAEMLEAFMFNSKKVPRNFVLRTLSDQAMDVSGTSLESDALFADVDMPDSSLVTEIDAPEDDVTITYRVLKRANQVLSLVMKQKVISDFSLILKMVTEEELKEGYQYKIDRKSLFRLIARLQKVKSLKLYKAVVKSENSAKTITFVCSNDIESDNSLIMSLIAQAQFRPVADDKKEGENSETTSVASSVAQLTKLHHTTETIFEKLPVDRNNMYGHCPRFIRMKLMHELVFYLTWDYSGEPETDQDSAREQLASRNYVSVPEDCPAIYRPATLDFRTFVPPLPSHEGWPQGWCLLADLVLRLPIFMFVRIVHIRRVIPGLQEILTHPVKKYMLLVHLPSQMRLELLGGSRKFLFTLFEVVQKLCFIGLIQFGPQRLKEKDQLFVYVNRRAVLLDTTDSPPAYFKVDLTISYPRHLHFLGNLSDVEAYWSELYQACMTTKLGVRLSDEGNEIVIEASESKHVLLEACLVRNALEAPELDIGILPGDQSGAAGMDSALFAHLKRNWQSKNLPKEHRFAGVSVEKHRKNISRKEIVRIEVKPKQLRSVLNIQKRRTRIVKRIMKRRKTTKKVPKIVEDTYKYRVRWSKEEEFILVLCKAASMYLMLNEASTRLPVQRSTLCKIMAKLCPRWPAKSSEQYLRRMHSMYNKSPSAQTQISIYLDEAYQCPVINNKFGGLLEKIRAKSLAQQEYENLLEKGFENLVMMLKEREKQVAQYSSQHAHIIIPDSVKEFEDKFTFVSTKVDQSLRKKYLEPKDSSDVQNSTIISLMLSILSLSAERSTYSKLISYIFQQYPDLSLRAAINWMKKAGLVVTKKRFMTKNKSIVAPLSLSPINFSLNYYYTFHSKIPFEVYQEAWKTLKCLQEENEFTLTGNKILGGQVAVLLEGLASGLTSASIDTSSQIISVEFDPEISPKEREQLYETFKRIDQCQQQLNMFQADTASKDEVFSPAKRLKLENHPLLFEGGSSQFSDDEEDESAPLPMEERLLTPMEKVTKVNVEARLAFYAKREQLHDMRSVNEKRDKRARLTIAPCPVLFVKEQSFGLSQIEIDGVLKSIVDDSSVKGDCPMLKTVLQSYDALNASEADILNATQLVQLISEAKLLGLTLESLHSKFEQGLGELSLAVHLGLLTSIGVIIRTGVTTFHYVHSSFKAPWLINSKADKDSADGEQIFVAIRPWIRLDGSINRRALDRFIGSVLMFIMCSPGCTLASLIEKISPAILPCHIRELVQMLCCLGCVIATRFVIPAVNAFSEPAPIISEPANFTEAESLLILEPTVDSITRMSQFIGDREYKTNFLEEIKNAAQLEKLGPQL